MSILDQFYTNEDVAKKYIELLKTYYDFNDYDYIIEPSAGCGAFYKLLPIDKRIGLDLEPKYEGVMKMDFFDFTPKENKKYLVIGNPPFGKSTLAVKFFNKCAEFADVIAFILPRIFKRVSIQNRLNLNFKMIYNEDLPIKPCCFTPKMNAKCCFQIWVRNKTPREKIKFDKTHNDFDILKYGAIDERKQPTAPLDYDFVIRAWGSNCGCIHDDYTKLGVVKSLHFIKSNIDIEELKNRFKSLDFSLSKDTVRQDSLGKYELIHLYKQKYGNHINLAY